MKKFWEFAKPRLFIGLIVAALIMSLSPIGASLNQYAERGFKTLTIGSQGRLSLTIGNVAHASGTLDYAWNGVNDNVNVAAAISVLNSHGGGELVMMTENYTFLASVNVPANVMIRGLGASTNISFNGVNPVFVATGANVVFRDFSTDAGGVTTLSTTLIENINGFTPTGRSASYVVAAPDSSPQAKAQADYLYVGTDNGSAGDAIMQAIIAANATGSPQTVVLLPGHYSNRTTRILVPTKVSLLGYGAVLKIADNLNAVAPDLIDLAAGDHHGTIVAGMELDGNDVNNMLASGNFGYGIFQAEYTSGGVLVGLADNSTVKDVYIHNTIFSNFVASGNASSGFNLRLANSLRDHQFYSSGNNYGRYDQVDISGYAKSQIFVIGTTGVYPSYYSRFTNVSIHDINTNPLAFPIPDTFFISRGDFNHIQATVRSNISALGLIQVVESAGTNQATHNTFDIDYEGGAKDGLIIMGNTAHSANFTKVSGTFKITSTSALGAFARVLNSNGVDLSGVVVQTTGNYLSSLVQVEGSTNYTGLNLAGVVYDNPNGALINVGSGTGVYQVNTVGAVYNAPSFITGTATRVLLSANSGNSTGTGAQQTIAHGLSFTPSKNQIAVFSDNVTGFVYQSANPDATNIYVTNNATGAAWHWATAVGR